MLIPPPLRLLSKARLVGSRRSRGGAAYPRRFEGTFLPSPHEKVTLEGWRSAGRVKSNQNSSFGCKNLARGRAPRSGAWGGTVTWRMPIPAEGRGKAHGAQRFSWVHQINTRGAAPARTRGPSPRVASGQEMLRASVRAGQVHARLSRGPSWPRPCGAWGCPELPMVGKRCP